MDRIGMEAGGEVMGQNPTDPNWGLSTAAANPTDPNWGQAPATKAETAPAETWASTIAAYAKTAGRVISEHPATAGAMALGTVASVASAGLALPAAVGLVGLAGAGGAGLGLTTKQIADRNTAPAPTVIGNVEEMATQGVAQAGGEALGRSVMTAAAGGGKWLMNRALNLPAQLSREFPELSQTAIDHALTVSKGGLANARSLLTQAKAVANQSLTDAAKSGATVPITVATSGLNKTLKAVADSSDPAGGLKALVGLEQKITAGRTATLTPAEADALKRSLQTESKALYKAVSAGNGRPSLTIAAQGKADMAAALNAELGKIAPGYAAANADAQEMIGATRGIANAIRPGSNLYQAMVRPGVGALFGGAAGESQGHPFMGALAGAAATSPGTMSRLAILLAHPVGQQILKQLPKGALLSLFGVDEPTSGSAAPSSMRPAQP